MKVKIEGVAGIIKNLAAVPEEYQKRIKRGLLKAGLFLQKESQSRVPVNTGFLKASAYTRVFTERPPEVWVGYTAYYALFVHEAPMKLKGKPRPGGEGRYWDPQGKAQNKFLEEPFRTYEDRLFEIVAEEARK